MCSYTQVGGNLQSSLLILGKAIFNLSLGGQSSILHYRAKRNFLFGDVSRLRRSRPHFFLIFPVKSGESGLGTLLKRTALKFCIEWSNRELLRPSRCGDINISFVRLRRSRPHFFCDLPPKSCESGLGTLLESIALKFCIESSNRELLRPYRHRDMSISLFLSTLGGHAPSFLRLFLLNRANQASGPF